MIPSHRVRTILTGAIVAALSPALSGHAVAEPHRDPQALAIVETVEKTLAPDGAWQKVGGLQFTFSVVEDGKPLAEFHHVWDLRTGQYRVQGIAKDGNERCVIFNVPKRWGKAWFQIGATTRDALPVAKPEKSDPPAPGSASPTPESPAPAPEAPVLPSAVSHWTQFPGTAMRKVVEWGYGRFINDTYWLLMPLKMKDPGVSLDYDGERKSDGEVYDVVKLTFENVGLTPGDTYWVYVNRKTHLIDRWDYVLQPEEGQEGPGEKSSWTWTGWKSFGPLSLATEKVSDDGRTMIAFKDVKVLSEIPKGAFDPPVSPK